MRSLFVIFCFLFSCSSSFAGTGNIPQNVELRLFSNESPTLKWAADRVGFELKTLYGTKSTVNTSVKEPFEGSDSGGLQILLAVQGKQTELTQWVKTNNLSMGADDDFGSNSYQVIALEKPLRVAIIGSDPVGAWYGACAWLDSLDTKDGKTAMPLNELSGKPELAYRFARPLSKPRDFENDADIIPTLDWWARWRLNYAAILPQPDDYTRKFLAQAHLRGIKVLLRISVRDLCASNDKSVEAAADQFSKFLSLGGDGISVLWDDLPKTRCDGHCIKCKSRFGPKGLPREISHILEAFCDAAERHPGAEYIFWCPPHYAPDRYKMEMPDEDFFRVIGLSEKVKAQTIMYYTQCFPQSVEILDRYGLKNRVWWYNGMRPPYQMLSRWKAPKPEMRLKAITDFDISELTDFAPFSYGEFMGVGIDNKCKILPPSQEKVGFLPSVPQRFQGFYPGTAYNPYHAAVSGLYAFSPKDFDQARADKLVFRAIFGPGSEKNAREWSDIYDELIIHIAKNDKQSRNVKSLVAKWQQLKLADQKNEGFLTGIQFDSVTWQIKQTEVRVNKLLSPTKPRKSQPASEMTLRRSYQAPQVQVSTSIRDNTRALHVP